MKKRRALAGLLSVILLMGASSCERERLSSDTDVSYNDSDNSGSSEKNPNLCRVIYELNGGTMPDGTGAVVEVEKGSTLDLPVPTRPGYDFAGWFYEGSGVNDPSKQWTNMDMVTRDITLNARYSTIGYSITYDLDGGTNDSANPSSYTVEDTVILKSPTKTGYPFTGWTGSNGDTPQKEVTIPKGTTGNLSYKANWEPLSTYFVGDTFTFGTYPQTAAGTDRTSIIWKVLSADNANHEYLVVSEKVLDQLAFYGSTSSRTINGSTVYANNYKYSNLRAWLNGYDGSSYNVSNYTGKGFLNTAFTAEEQAMIMTTTVDNSVASTGFSSNRNVCEDTQDKIFAMSYSEVTNSSYGFSSNSDRKSNDTDYASAQGADNYYWLRSPSNVSGFSAEGVNIDGNIYNRGVRGNNVGVRPAFRMKIS